MDRVKPVSTPRMLIAAFPTTAPEGSVIVPWIDPPFVDTAWAKLMGAAGPKLTPKLIAAAKARGKNFFILCFSKSTGARDAVLQLCFR